MQDYPSKKSSKAFLVPQAIRIFVGRKLHVGSKIYAHFGDIVSERGVNSEASVRSNNEAFPSDRWCFGFLSCFFLVFGALSYSLWLIFLSILRTKKQHMAHDLTLHPLESNIYRSPNNEPYKS